MRTKMIFCEAGFMDLSQLDQNVRSVEKVKFIQISCWFWILSMNNRLHTTRRLLVQKSTAT